MSRPYEIPERYRARYAAPPAPLGEDELSLRWLGTAGYELRTARTTLLIDPYLTRASVARTLFTPLEPGAPAIDAVVSRADYVLTGHSHFDHLMDVPYIAARTGAVVAGSESTCNLAAACGVPEGRLIRVKDDRALHEMGDFQVRFVPSQHGRIFGWRPFPGRIGAEARLPLRAHAYRMGGAYGIQLRVGDLTLYHNGSADLIEAEMEGLRADVLLLGLAGRLGTPDYVGRMAGLLRPRYVVPTHYDHFFRPLSEGIRLLPFVRMDDFFLSAAARAREARVVMPGFLEEVRLPLSGRGEPRIPL